MLFSGMARAYRCDDCQKVYSYTLPTSVIPLLLTIWLAGAFWFGVLSLTMKSKLISMPFTIVITLCSHVLAVYIHERLAAPWSRSGKCSECNSALTGVGGGFVNGGGPVPGEILVYVLEIFIPAALYVAVENLLI